MLTRILLLLAALLWTSTAFAESTSSTTLAAGTANRLPITIELAMTAAQTDTAIVTVSAGTKIVVTQAAYLCANSNTVDVGVRIGFGATTTPTTTGVVLTHPGVAAGSGYNRGDGSGTLGIGADGEDLRITSSVPTTGSCRALITYFTTATGS